MSTIRRVIYKGGYHKKVARKKPFINKINRKKRMTFAKEFISKEKIWSNDIIFVDESKFEFLSLS